MSLPLSERFTTPRQNWSALWSSLGPISNDTPQGKELEAVHLPPAALAAADLVRVVTPHAALALSILAPSCGLGVGAVALPVFNLRGEVYELSCELGSVFPAAPQDGLLLNHPALRLLSVGDPSPPPHAAVIVEGVFDFLTWSLIRPDLPVIGLLDAPGCTRQIIARLYQLEFERAWQDSLSVAVRVQTPTLAATIRAGLSGLNVPPIHCADQHKLFRDWDIIEGDDPLSAAATLGVPVASPTAATPPPPDEEPPPPPAAVAVEADTMHRQAFDVEAAQATAAAPVIDDNHTTQLDEHADPSPPAVAAPALGGAAAVDDAAHTNTSNEEAHGEEDIDRAARAVACAATDANQNADEEAVDGEGENYTDTEKKIEEALEGVSAAPATGAPVFDLSVGCGAAKNDRSPEAAQRRRPHAKFIPMLKSDGSEDVRGLARVRPLKLTFKQFVDLLRSHMKRKYERKPGPFIVGATFNASDKHPTGHRHGEHLICVTMLMLDIDNAPDFPTTHLEECLKSLAVAGVGYTTWSHGRRDVPKPKTGTCARVILPLARPLTAPADLPWLERVKLIGRQLAALVGFIGERLGIPPDSTALDKVSTQPEQLMYTPRMPAPGVKAWFTYQDGPALDPDNLPGGVTLAALLGASHDQQATLPNTPTSPPSDTPRAEPTAPQPTPAQQLTHATPSPTASPKPPRTSPTAPQFSGPPADDQEKSERRVLKWAAANSVDLGTRTTSGDVIKYLPPHCPCSRKCPDGSVFFINSDASHPFHCQHRTCPANNNWQGLKQYIKSKTNENGAQPDTKTPDANTSSAAPSTANDAQPDTTPPHAEAASVAPRRSPPFAKGNPELGTCLALRNLFNSLLRQDPPDQRPHLVCIDSVEDIDAIAAKIPDGKTVWIAIPTKHRLYPHAFNTFRSKGCEICLRDSSHV